MTVSSRQIPGVCQLEAHPLRQHLATPGTQVPGGDHDQRQWHLGNHSFYNFPHQPSMFINSRDDKSHRSETLRRYLYLKDTFQAFPYVDYYFQKLDYFLQMYYYLQIRDSVDYFLRKMAIILPYFR